MSEIRPAEARDLDEIMLLLSQARAAIARLGIDQWQDGYPEREQIRADIEAGAGVAFVREGRVAGYMALQTAPEPVYARIDGAWRCAGPYLTVHRMAIADGFRGGGLSVEMLNCALERAKSAGMRSVRADTHRGNRAMRRLLEKCGYAHCGEVRYEVTAGDPIRAAYELPISGKESTRI